MTCENEHTIHVEPNQQDPERYWVTCGEETIAELIVNDEETTPESFSTWIIAVANAHFHA